MTAPTTQENPAQTEQKPNDKEYNFRALEAKYQRQNQQLAQQLELERQAKADAERKYQEATQRSNRDEDDEDDDSSEPYLEKKRFRKEAAKIKQEVVKTKQDTLEDVKQAIHEAKLEAKREAFIESNPDFFDTLEQHAEKIMLKSPALGKSLLAMPDNFDRQKLVYQTIKELGLDKPEMKQQSIQEKVDANRKGPFYQPSNVGTTPYVVGGDFSPTGQKQAYEKMQALKSQLRI